MAVQEWCVPGSSELLLPPERASLCPCSANERRAQQRASDSRYLRRTEDEDEDAGRAHARDVPRTRSDAAPFSASRQTASARAPTGRIPAPVTRAREQVLARDGLENQTCQPTSAPHPWARGARARVHSSTSAPARAPSSEPTGPAARLRPREQPSAARPGATGRPEHSGEDTPGRAGRPRRLRASPSPSPSPSPVPHSPLSLGPLIALLSRPARARRV